MDFLKGIIKSYKLFKSDEEKLNGTFFRVLWTTVILTVFQRLFLCYIDLLIVSFVLNNVVVALGGVVATEQGIND